jgi:hypothetical protein
MDRGLFPRFAADVVSISGERLRAPVIQGSRRWFDASRTLRNVITRPDSCGNVLDRLILSSRLPGPGYLSWL